MKTKTKTLREQVEEFHLAMGQPVLDHPQVPDSERVKLRLRLIAEEFFELLEAAGVEEAVLENIRRATLLVVEVKDPSAHSVDLVEVADALADLDYVVEGTRLEFGIDGAPIAQEVHRSNMAKLGGKVREDGKILKPDDWTPPDILGKLREQGMREQQEKDS